MPRPYDYAKGRGTARSLSLGWLTTMACQVPVLGETFMRLQQFIIMRAVLRGGVANRESISPALMKEMYLVGNRRGHYRAFVHLLRHAGSWEAATGDYANIKVPVCLIWGDQDWCRPSERERHRAFIPGAQIVTVESTGCPSIVRTNYAS